MRRGRGSLLSFFFCIQPKPCQIITRSGCGIYSLLMVLLYGLFYFNIILHIFKPCSGSVKNFCSRLNLSRLFGVEAINECCKVCTTHKLPISHQSVSLGYFAYLSRLLFVFLLSTSPKYC